MNYKAGDFFLVDGTAWTDKMIQFGQRVRRWWKPNPANKQYAWATHSGLIVSDSGDIIEALGNGLERNHISDYANRRIAIVSPPLNQRQRRDGIRWAEAEFERHCKYGFTDIASIIIQMLTPARFDFNWNGSMICSACVARYLEHGGETLSTFSPFVTTPGDLAFMYEVPKP